MGIKHKSKKKKKKDDDLQYEEPEEIDNKKFNKKDKEKVKENKEKESKDKKNDKNKNDEDEEKKEENENENNEEENQEDDKKDSKKEKKKYKLDKRKVYEIFSSEICQKCPIPFNEKIGIFIDDFKKYIIVKATKDCERPETIEYDMKCYPKSNPHNMELVDDYKKIIKDNYDEFNMIFNACLLSKIADGGTSTENIFISYITGMEVVKKMIELKKNGLEPPKNSKNFYQVNISKNMVEKIFGDSATKKQEGNFVLDCIDKKKSRYRVYNPLLDKNLTPFFSTNLNKKFLQTGGFVTNKGFIVYDSVYRDTLGSIPKKKKEDIKPDELMNTINEIQVSHDIHNKEKEAQEETVRKNPILKTQVAAFKYKPIEFDLYQTQKLPPIKNRGGAFHNRTSSTNMQKKNDNFNKTSQ